MRNLKNVVSILFVSMTFSCSNSALQEHEKTATSNEKAVANTEQGPKHDESAGLELSLNSGAKWDSDESTFTGMKRLELTLYNFKENSDNPAIDDYNKLGKTLANINADIIKQCSMQGSDHDMLHVLLVPMLENVDVIKNGKEIEKAKYNVQELERAVATFFEYFKV